MAGRPDPLRSLYGRCSWLGSRGAKAFCGLHEDNTRAAGFYTHHGFRDTGRREVYPLDVSKKEIIMEYELAAAEPRARPCPET